MKILIDNGDGLGFIDYTHYVQGDSISIQDSINVPTLCSLLVSNVDGAFKIPVRSAYLKIISQMNVAVPSLSGAAPSGNLVLFSGYITNETEREFLGVGRGAVNQGFQQYNYTVHATSDEWLLNAKSVPFIPAFVNTSQGAILRNIANALAPGMFDLSGIQDGDVVPFYQYSSDQTWSDLAKKFADASRYHYYCRNHKIYYVPFGDLQQSIKYNDARPAKESTFDPHSLQSGVLTVPMVNDAIVLGDIEPQNIREDNCVGTGFDSNFQLAHEMFEGTTSVLLQQTWTSPDFGTDVWTLNDAQGYFDFSAGAMNITSGPGALGNGIFGDNIIANNVLQLGGALHLQHGEFLFTNQINEGLLGGVYPNQEHMQLADCIAGFKVSSYGGLPPPGPGQLVVLVYPTSGFIATAIPSASGNTTASFDPGYSGGQVTMTSSAPLGNVYTNIVFNGFSDPVLPVGSVVNKIYGLASVSHSQNTSLGGAGIGGGAGLLTPFTLSSALGGEPFDFPGEFVPFPTGTFTTTDCVADLGSTSVSGASIGFGLHATLSQPSFLDQVIASGVAFAIYYTPPGGGGGIGTTILSANQIPLPPVVTATGANGGGTMGFVVDPIRTYAFAISATGSGSPCVLSRINTSNNTRELDVVWSAGSGSPLQSIAVDSDGFIYIINAKPSAGTTNPTLWKLDKDFNIIASVVVPCVTGATTGAARSGNLIIIDRAGNKYLAVVGSNIKTPLGSGTGSVIILNRSNLTTLCSYYWGNHYTPGGGYTATFQGVADSNGDVWTNMANHPEIFLQFSFTAGGVVTATVHTAVTADSGKFTNDWRYDIAGNSIIVASKDFSQQWYWRKVALPSLTVSASLTGSYASPYWGNTESALDTFLTWEASSKTQWAANELQIIYSYTGGITHVYLMDTSFNRTDVTSQFTDLGSFGPNGLGQVKVNIDPASMNGPMYYDSKNACLWGVETGNNGDQYWERFNLSASTPVVPGIGVDGVNLQPVWKGALYPGIVTRKNHKYFLQTIFNANFWSRYNQSYKTLGNVPFGGTNVESDAVVTWIISDFDYSPPGDWAAGTITAGTLIQPVANNPGGFTFVCVQGGVTAGTAPASWTQFPGDTVVDGGVIWSNNSDNIVLTERVPTLTQLSITGSLPSFAIYGLIQNQTLFCSVTDTIAYLPPQCKLSVRSLVGPSGAQLPITPALLGDDTEYLVGFGGINEVATVGQAAQNTNVLQFYSDRIPAVGARVKLRSWEAGVAVGRVQDPDSVAREAAVVGDDGIRLAIMSDMQPPPATSAECELAAAAAIKDRVNVQFQGSYTVLDNFWSPSLDYPRPGRYFTVNSPQRGMANLNLLTSTVNIRVVELRQEKLEFSVNFGPDLYLEKLLPKFLAKSESVLAPQPPSVRPNPIKLAELNTTYLDDLAYATVLTYDSTSVTFDLGAVPVSGAEIRRSDLGWGMGTQVKNLVGIFTTRYITLPRTTYDQRWYVRQVNGGKSSRNTAVLRIVAPLIPAAPIGTLDVSTPAVPQIKLNFGANTDIRNICGIEIRAADNSTVLFQRRYGAPSDLDFIISNSVNKFVNFEFYCYFFNLLWGYSAPLHLTAGLIPPSIKNLKVNDTTKICSWEIDTDTPNEFFVDITGGTVGAPTTVGPVDSVIPGGAFYNSSEWEIAGISPHQLRTTGSATSSAHQLGFVQFRNMTGFSSVPDDAVILGIKLDLQIFSQANTVATLQNVSLISNGAQYGKIKNVNIPFTTTPTSINQGSSSDTWDVVDQIKGIVIKDPSFGFQVQAYVSTVRLFMQTGQVTVTWKGADGTVHESLDLAVLQFQLSDDDFYNTRQIAVTPFNQIQYGPTIALTHTFVPGASGNASSSGTYYVLGAAGQQNNGYFPVNSLTTVIADDGYVHVREYGAKGDGVTDDTAAIQASVNVASISGRNIVLVPSDMNCKVNASQLSGGNYFALTIPANVRMIVDGNLFVGSAGGSPSFVAKQNGSLFTNVPGWKYRHSGLYRLASSQSIAPKALMTLVEMSASGGPVTVTLPSAAGCSGAIFWIKKIDSTANGVTVSGSIDGANSQLLASLNNFLGVTSSGTGWDVISAGSVSSLAATGASGQVLTSTGGTGATMQYLPSQIGYVVPAGVAVAGNNIGPDLTYMRAGQLNRCVVTVKASDPSVDLIFRVKKNGVSIFSSNPTVAHATSTGTKVTFTSLTSVPFPLADGDVFTLDVVQGSSSWDVTIQCVGP